MRSNSWVWVVLNAKSTKQCGTPKEHFLDQISDIIRELVSRIVEELVKYLSGPDRDAVMKMPFSICSMKTLATVPLSWPLVDE